ncbi:glycosyltransferase family 2 protein [Gryllotalpicola reticulitermitis]|uniref:Glycosyltransferase family 2 protein n=1 Tax=Gryllotalpicola reticulitermitis TaxID=1184153 RepID=A0ABV8Q877_9MICO
MALCTRNGASYLTEQLHSVFTQTVPVAELIVSDDDSSDGTVALAGRLAADAGVRMTLLENRPPLGVTKNFEQAVRHATGDLVALADQDDIWHPDKLERATAVFDDPSALLVHSDARLVGPDGEPLGSTMFEQLEVPDEELRLEESGRGFDAVLRRNLATGATVLFRRSLLERALPFPETWVHDEWLAAIAASYGGLRVLREPTVDYRLHGANQIGVEAPTLRRKVNRVVGEPRGDRNRVLALKFAELAARLAALDDVPDALKAAANDKAQFERVRARMPRARALRTASVTRLMIAGGYGRFASRGRFDILRDLLQRA